jgi:hypothetical protein
VPELTILDGAAKVRVFAEPDVLDALDPSGLPAGTLAGRIAPNELIVVGEPGTGAALADTLGQAVAEHGPAALVIDHTDGWSLHSLQGADLEEVWARVSHIPLPAGGDEPTFLAGRICDVAGKAFVRRGRVDILTGSEAREHVEHRLADAGRAFGLGHATAGDSLGTKAVR